MTDPGGMGGPVTVLLADDASDIRLLIGVVLARQPDFEVVGEAEDGAVAVEMAARLQPDLVVIDLAMPVMDGLEAIPAIRREAPGARIVALSGFRAGEMAKEAQAAGADGYLEKGTSPDRMVQLLREALGRSAPAPSTSPGAAAAGRFGGLSDAHLSAVRHDLMSPLTVIEGFASMMEQRAGQMTEAEVRDFAERISRSAQRIRAQLDALLNAKTPEL